MPSPYPKQTHEVLNQPPFIEPYDLFATDPILGEVIESHGANWAREKIAEYGKLAGGPLMELGFQANEHKPVLKTHDRYGHRINYVEFHPAYHELMRTAIHYGIPSLPWRAPRRGAHVARAALEYLHNQAESGTGCPLTMTFACVPALKKQVNLFKQWEPKIFSTEYDGDNKPWTQKSGVTLGMWMTEKQGGSDVRANSTQAHPLGTRSGPGESYELVGHKWFCSAPMSDAFLTLAKTDQGLSCFLLPRWKPDGTLNDFQIIRLKNKLGNWANASSEVELTGCYAEMVGNEGQGIKTIIEMVAMTRFDCMVGSTSTMRQGLVQALHHTRHRKAFGAKLIGQPLMAGLLADMALEVEASLRYVIRVAQALDNPSDTHEASLARIAIPMGKYWICKRTMGLINEAQECLGGLGYVEDSILPRLFREAPLNSIWEGSGNVQCLDVVRAIKKDPQSLPTLIEELTRARGHASKYDRALDGLVTNANRIVEEPYQFRGFVERCAVLFQAAQLIRSSPNEIADQFIESRLSPHPGPTYGAFGCKSPQSVLARTWPINL